MLLISMRWNSEPTARHPKYHIPSSSPRTSPLWLSGLGPPCSATCHPVSGGAAWPPRCIRSPRKLRAPSYIHSIPLRVMKSVDSIVVLLLLIKEHPKGSRKEVRVPASRACCCLQPLRRPVARWRPSCHRRTCRERTTSARTDCLRELCARSRRGSSSRPVAVKSAYAACPLRVQPRTGQPLHRSAFTLRIRRAGAVGRGRDNGDSPVVAQLGS